MRGADFQLRKVTVHRIRGRVIDENGKPATQASVMAIPLDGAISARSMGAVRNSEGTFEIAGVTPGSYTLLVNRASREERRTVARQQVQVGNRDLDGVVINLMPAFEISGSVRAPEGVNLSSVRVALEPLDSSFPNAGEGAKKDAAGAFVFPSVAPGEYRFAVANLPAGTYLKSVSVQGQDITNGALIGAAASGVSIDLAAGAPELSGNVLDADKQPVASAFVVLVPGGSNRQRYWMYRNAVSDQSGAFTVSNVVPGKYTAYAFVDVDEGVWHSSDFMKQFEGKGVSLALEEGAKESLQLTPVQ
jgi:hypothetical protein